MSRLLFRRIPLAVSLGVLLAGALTGLAPTAQAATANGAVIVTTQRTGRVVELTISTPAFSKLTYVDVDLPTGYDANPSKRWPVAYFTAGTSNTYASFNQGNGVALTANFPAIVVSPNGDSGYWSDWYNGGANGTPMYETYVVSQLIPLIDATFRTVPNRQNRAIMGISMGGYGAMMLAARHPDLFSAVASLSGADDSNVPELAAAVSVSSTFDGGAVDAIYGPRSTQAVRWHGHNPADLAANLRTLDVQVRGANGTLNPAIGESATPVDLASCLVEAGTYKGTTSMHNTLTVLGIAHLWKDYGAGCHTPQNFARELVDTIAYFTQYFSQPKPDPTTFTYSSIEPSFSVWNWSVTADPSRALEFLRLAVAGPSTFTVTGSGLTTVLTPAVFAPQATVYLCGATTASANADATGRVRLQVSLAAPNLGQQYSPGVLTIATSRTVRLSATPTSC